MTDRIRFHLDENVDPAVADGLRRRGVDVCTAKEVGLLEAPDEAHLEYARQQGRVTVTHDEDFLVFAAAEANHVGIAYCHIESRKIGEIIAGLMLVYDCLTPDEMRDHVEFL